MSMLFSLSTLHSAALVYAKSTAIIGQRALHVLSELAINATLKNKSALGVLSKKDGDKIVEIFTAIGTDSKVTKHVISELHSNAVRIDSTMFNKFSALTK